MESSRKIRIGQLDTSTGLLTGSGITNRFAKFTSSTTLTGSTSLTELPNGFIGIGTTNPLSLLHVSGSVLSNSFVKSGGTSNQFLMADGSVSFGPSGSVGGTGTTNYIPKWSSTTAQTNSTIFDNGNVGIGTTNPLTNLQINGFDNSRARVVSVNPAFDASWESSDGTNLVGSGLLAGSGGAQGAWSVYNTGIRMTVLSNGFVGIDTTTPEYKLDVVNGDISLYRTQKLQFSGPTTGDRNRAYIGGNPNNDLIFGIGGGTEAVRITNGGRFLINSTIPNGIDYLEVNGSAISSAWRTSGGTSAQYVKGDGSLGAISGLTGSTSSGGVGGTGTLNYVSKWSSTTGLTNSQIFDNGTNVGIGTDSPSSKLYVTDVPNVGIVTIDMPAVNNSPTGGVPDALVIKTKGHNGTTNSLVSGVYVTPEGNKNVGFAFNSANAVIDITNSVGFQGDFKASSTNNFFLRNRKNGVVNSYVTDNGAAYYAGVIKSDLGLQITNNSGNPFIDLITTPSNSSIIYDKASSQFRIYNTGVFGLAITNSGNVLIGTATDNLTDKLQVNGSIYSTTSVKAFDFRTTGNGFITYDGDNLGTGTLSIRSALAGTVMYFNPNGNVGVGTTTPQAKLDIIGGGLFGNSAGSFNLEVGSDANNAFIRGNNIANSLLLYNPSGKPIIMQPYVGNVVIGSTTDNTVDRLQVGGTIAASPATQPHQVVVKSQIDSKINTIELGNPPDYYRTVILLHNLDNANIDSGANFQGEVWIRRFNGLYPPTVIKINSMKEYNGSNAAGNVYYSNQQGFVRMVTFNYGGIKWLGAVVSVSDASAGVTVNGYWSTTPILVSYFDANSSTVLNAEINSSITDYSYTNGSVSFDSNVISKRYINTGFFGSNQSNARNHFNQNRAGNEALATGWIASAFGDNLGGRIVIGQYDSKGIIAGHNGDLTDWDDVYISPQSSRNVIIGTTTNNGVDRLQVNGSIFANQFKSGYGDQLNIAGQWITGAINGDRFYIYNAGIGGDAIRIFPATNNVAIGGIADNGYKFQVNGSAWFNGDITTVGKLNSYGVEGIRMINDNAYISAYNTSNSVRTGYIQLNTGGNSVIMNEANSAWIFGTNATERMRLASSGDLLIGTTNDNLVDKLQVNGSGRFVNNITSFTTSPTGTLDFALNLIKRNVSDSDNSTVGLLLTTEASGDLGKSAIVHTRTGPYGIGDIRFLLNSDFGPSLPTLGNTKFVIKNNGDTIFGNQNGQIGSPTKLIMDSSYNDSVISATKLKIYLHPGSGGVGNPGGSGDAYGFGIGNAGDIQYYSGMHKFFTNNNQTMTIVSGNVLIGTTTDSGHNLRVNGAASFLSSVDTNGSLYSYGGISVGTAGARNGPLAGVNSIAIGDSDTGFRQNGDGVIETYANGTLVKTETSGAIFVNLNLIGRKPTPDNISTPTFGGSAFEASSNNSLTANSDLFYPIIQGYSTVVEGYANFTQFGYVRDLPANNGYGAIKLTGDGALSVPKIWKFKNNGDFVSSTISTDSIVVNGITWANNELYLGNNDPSFGIRFMQGTSSDLVLGVRGGTRTMELRNGNYASPNFGACSFKTGFIELTNDINVNGTVFSNGLKYRHPIQIGSQDLNNFNEAGFYAGSALGNAPDGGWFYVTVEGHSDASWVHQTVTSYGSGNSPNRTYSRVKVGGNWVGWVETLNSGNYNLFSPTLGGGGASGTWGINVTGTARKIDIGTSASIGDVNIFPTEAASVRFDTFDVNAANKPVSINNSNGVISFTINHGPQYGKQIAFADNDDLYIRRLTANNYQSWLTILHSGNYPNYTLAARNRTNWNDGTVINNVIGQLTWKNYGNNHTIFDASAGSSPDGSGINNTNSQQPWTPTYPTLMGWDGGQTFGVRVDSARAADRSTYFREAQFIMEINTAVVPQPMRSMLYNTIGGTFVLNRNSQGSYQIVNTGYLTTGKTTVQFQMGVYQGGTRLQAYCGQSSDGNIVTFIVASTDTGNVFDYTGGMLVTVRVYN